MSLRGVERRGNLVFAVLTARLLRSARNDKEFKTHYNRVLFNIMDTGKIIETIKNTESPLKRQLLMAGLVTKLLENINKDMPTVIGGCALSYYSREVYFTSDIDIAYSDREALDKVLSGIGFNKEGRYWINEELKIASVVLHK
jgi:hypothetical protein